MDNEDVKIPETLEVSGTPEPNKEDVKDLDKEILDEIREATYNVGDVGEEEEEDTEDEIEGRLLTNQNYIAPKDEDKFVDTSKNELIDKANLTEFDVIKAVAKQNGNEIRNPRSGCKKCYGRGWIGKDFNTKAPIPCHCIYPIKTQAQKIAEFKQEQKIMPAKYNAKMFKQLKKLIKAEKKLVNKQKHEEEKRLKDLEG